jgi:hypothetical protein
MGKIVHRRLRRGGYQEGDVRPFPEVLQEAVEIVR